MAATDPIEKIHQIDHDTGDDHDIGRTLTALAALPPSLDAPYLSLSLDWRPAGDAPGRMPAPEPRRSERRSATSAVGPSWRPSREEMNRELDALVAAHGPRGEAFDSISADVARIGSFLDDQLDPAAQGVVIIACAATGVFVPLALGLPAPTRLVTGPTPALGVLARLREDHPVYAVLVADQIQAHLSFIDQSARDRSVVVEGSGYPRKQKQGGWSQRRYQARADERVAAFARGVAEEVQRALDDASVSMLIVAGDEIITSALDDTLHPTVKDRLIATIRLDIDASEQEILDATLSIAERAERAREAADVQTLHDAVGAGSRGAAGAEDTLTALQAGQVMTLVVNDDFSASGWADYTFPLFGAGDIPVAHPAGGDPEQLVPIALEEEMIRLALATGAEVQIVHSALPVEVAADEPFPEAGTPAPRTEAASTLDALGGVGALLRFTLDDDQPVAEI